MIPKEWKTLKGSEIAIKITKGSSPKWQGFDYQSSGCLFVTSENVRDGYLDISTPKFLPEGFFLKQKNSQLQIGDILINIVGASIGRSCLYSSNYKMANINQAVCLFRPKKEFNSKYIGYFLQAPSTIIKLLGTQTESARPNLSLTDIKSFMFLIPSRKEQDKIANILSTWDEAIEKLEKLIEAKKLRKKYIEQDKFYELLNSKSTSFDDVFERVTKKNKNNESSNVLTISAQLGLISQAEYFNRQIASKNITGYYLLEKGEFAYNKSYSKGYPLGAIKSLELYDFGVVSTLYICFKLKEKNKVNVSFYKHFFESGAFNRQIYTIAQEGARNHGLLNISVPDFFKLRVPLVSKEQKINLSAAFDNMDKEITLLNKKLKSIKKQKKGLMQQLLTGNKRVKID